MFRKYLSIFHSRNPSPATRAVFAGAALAVAASGGFLASARANPVVSEQFNYGTGTTNLSGGNGGTGFSGAWTTQENVGNAGYTNLTTNSYTDQGLSLGNLSTSGGAAFASITPATAVNFGYRYAYDRPLGVTLTGTVYGGFVSNFTSTYNGDSTGLFLIDNAGGADPYPAFGIAVQPYGNFNASIVMGNYPDSVESKGTSALTGPALSSGTTYLYLFQLTNVGGIAGTAQSESAWVLTSSQYNHFAASNTLDPSNLNAAGTGTASTNVTEMGSLTDSPSNMGYINPSPTLGDWLSIQNFDYQVGNNLTAAYGDIRLSSTSLADVAPVPEPSTSSIFGFGAAGLGLLMLLRRRVASARTV